MCKMESSRWGQRGSKALQDTERTSFHSRQVEKTLKGSGQRTDRT